MKINGVEIPDSRVKVGLETESFPFYKSTIDLDLEDGKYVAYMNEYGLSSRDEVDGLIEVYSKRSSRMGVELYDDQTNLIWSRPVISP